MRLHLHDETGYKNAGWKTHAEAALHQYSMEMRRGDLSRAWRKLENALHHRPTLTMEHNSVHWLMLKFGQRIFS